MFANIRNVITRLSMNRLRPNLDGHIPSCPRHVPTIWLPWQRPLLSNGTLNILQLWASGGRTRKPILMKFGTLQQIRTTMTDTRSNIKIFKIQNGGRQPYSHVGKYWKCHNSPINGPIGIRLGWTGWWHPITFQTCPHDAVAMATAIA